MMDYKEYPLPTELEEAQARIYELEFEVIKLRTMLQGIDVMYRNFAAGYERQIAQLTG